MTTLQKRKKPHKSDCAIYNGPAYRPGVCDCGAVTGMKKWLQYIHTLFSIYFLRGGSYD